MPNAESRNVFVNSRQVKQRYGDASDMWVHRRLHDKSGTFRSQATSAVGAFGGWPIWLTGSATEPLAPKLPPPELRSPWVGGPGALFFFEPPTLHVGRKESHSATPL